MLVLNRKADQAIVIGGGIRVVVCAVEGNQVKLGIEAPKGVAVDREEIARRKALGRACRRERSVA